MANIAVVGAGVVGLSTALNIKKRMPSARITIYADRFGNQTTSSGAGGLFRPNIEHCPGTDPETVKRWSSEAFKEYSTRAISSDGANVGHIVAPGYVFSDTKVKDPLYKDIVFSFRELEPKELKALGVKYKYGYQVTTVITDMSRYLPWLMTRFKESGGTLVYKTVNSLEEFVGQYDVVVNCSGFRSKDLVGDKSVYPVRGHLLKVKAPWIKNWLYTEDLAYFVPGFDYLSLGGTRQRGNTSTKIDPEDTKGILERCHKVWPALKGATIVKEWVDFRPHRDPVRVELETMHFGKGSIKVVHNYGHGANGITLSWGTSQDAAKLVVEALKGIKSNL